MRITNFRKGQLLIIPNLGFLVLTIEKIGLQNGIRNLSFLLSFSFFILSIRYLVKSNSKHKYIVQVRWMIIIYIIIVIYYLYYYIN